MPQPVDRRNFLIAVPAFVALSACVPNSKTLKGSWGQFSAGTGRTVDHGAWDAFLERFLRPSLDGVNRIAYAKAAQADAMMLRPYLASLEAIDPVTLSKDEQMAFWINLYNAATIDLILQKPTVKSIRDLGALTLGPWDKNSLPSTAIACR